MTQLPLYSVQIIDGSLNLVNYTQEVDVSNSDLYTSQIETTNDLETEESSSKSKKREEKYDCQKIKTENSSKLSPKKVSDKSKVKIKFRKQFKEFKRKQLFRRQWMDLEAFKDWLEESIMPDKAYCKACCRDMTAGKSELLNHSRSKRHVSNFYKMLSKEKDLDPEPIALGISMIDSCSEEIVDETDPSFLTAFTRIIDFRNDSMSTPNFVMKKAMCETDANKLKTIPDLEELAAKSLQKDKALYFPTHTMANLVAILSHCQGKGSSVFCGDCSEIYVMNKKSLMQFGGLCCIGIENRMNGTFSVDDLEVLLKDADNRWPLQHLVCVESSHLRKGGVVPPIEWIQSVSNMSYSWNCLVHCDGTRLVNSCIYLQVPLAEIGRSCDSVTVALDKSLGAPLGAVLAGDSEFIRRCKKLRDSLGGTIHQGDMFASAGVFALSDIESITNDHRRAFALSIAIAKEECNQIQIDRSYVQTNVVNLHLQNGVTADDFMQRLSCVMEGETEQCDGNSIIIFTERIDLATVSFRIHNNISDHDIILVKKKIKYILKELKNSVMK